VEILLENMAHYLKIAAICYAVGISWKNVVIQVQIAFTMDKVKNILFILEYLSYLFFLKFLFKAFIRSAMSIPQNILTPFYMSASNYYLLLNNEIRFDSNLISIEVYMAIAGMIDIYVIKFCLFLIK
jgi:hypothetical protein